MPRKVHPPKVQIAPARVAYSIAEAAEAMGVCTSFVRMEIDRKRLKAARFGRRVVILAADLSTYLASARIKGAA